MDCESFQIFDHPKRHKETGLKSLGDLAVGHMGILDDQLEAQVPVQTKEVEVGEMPESVESFQVFETYEHAESLMVVMTDTTSVDIDPEMEVAEGFGFLSCCHAGYFALTSDMIDGLGPGGGDLYKGIVLEYFLGLSVYLVTS